MNDIVTQLVAGLTVLWCVVAILVIVGFARLHSRLSQCERMLKILMDDLREAQWRADAHETRLEEHGTRLSRLERGVPSPEGGSDGG